MPLLGRHKSLPGNNQAAQKQQQQQQQQQQALVCESPLFGTRRQLPVSSGSAAAAAAASTATPSGKQALAKHQSWSTGGVGRNSRAANSEAASSSAASSNSANSANSAPASSPLLAGSSAAETLASIPKQITRQQIHYAFSIMDTNSDGLIDLRDLSQMLANLGVPIDEAILSHVMSSVSKRGDHRISEAEFLDWIGNFIQVKESDVNHSTSSASRAANSRNSTQRGQSSNAASRSSSSPVSALVAQSAECEALIEQQMRQRRGSGSGLALMRSLSSSSSSSPSSIATSGQAHSSGSVQDDRKQRRQQLASCSLAEQQKEACDDLKAAFCVFDLDGDGYITIDEVQKGLKLLGETWSLAELNQLLFSKCEPQPPQPLPPSSSSNKKKLASGTNSSSSSSSSSSSAQKQRISIDDFVKLLL